MHNAPWTNTSVNTSSSWATFVNALISVRFSSRDRLTREAPTLDRNLTCPSLCVVSWVEACISKLGKYFLTRLNSPRSCTIMPSIPLFTNLFKSLIMLTTSRSKITVFKVKKISQSYLWASLTIPVRSSKDRLVARLRALKVSRPQYTALAPATMAALMVLTSPPGANSSIFLVMQTHFCLLRCG